MPTCRTGALVGVASKDGIRLFVRVFTLLVLSSARINHILVGLVYVCLVIGYWNYTGIFVFIT
jgi:hypothetical protein